MYTDSEVRILANKNLKNRVSFSNAMDRQTYEALEKLHLETHIPKSKLLDEAVQLLLKKYSESNQ